MCRLENPLTFMTRKPPRAAQKPRAKKTAPKRRSPRVDFSLVDAINDAIVIFDQKGTVLSVNPEFEKRTGLKKRSLVGKSGEFLIGETIKREELKKITKILAQARQGQLILPVLTTFVTREGREIPIFFATSYLRNRRGNPTHIIITIKDISEITGKLAEHRKHLKRLVENRTAEIRAVNQKFRKEVEERRIAERELKKARAHLEKKIRERTTQLEKVNRKLEARIARHRDADDALRRSEKTARIVFDSIGEGVVVTDRNGTILQVNDTAVKNSGHRYKRDLVGRSAFEFVRIRDRSLIRKEGKHILSSRKSRIVEHTILTRDGAKLPTESNVSPLKDRRGRSVGFIITSRVIEPGKPRRREPAGDESDLTEITDSLPQAIFEADVRGNLTYANRHAFSAFQYSRDDFEKGLNALEMVVPEDRIRARRNIRRVLKGEKVRAIEYTARRKDGSTFPIIIYSLPILEAGRPAGVRGIIVDISERKQAEEELSRARAELEQRVAERTARLEIANEQLRIEIEARKKVEQLLKDVEREKAVILDSMSEQVIFHDREMRIIWANRAACESVDLAPGEITGRYCYEIWHGRDEPCDGCPVIQSRETGSIREAEIYSPDGRVWHVRGYPVKNADGGLEGVVEVTADITRRKRAEDLIRKQHELGIALGSAPSLTAVLALCLDTALEISGMDCGGIYLVDEHTGALDLLHHRGFHLDEFVPEVSRYSRETPQARLAALGNSVYASHRDLDLPPDDIRFREGLHAISVIPIRYRGNVIACLNVASHTLDEIPLSSRQALETISTYIGSGIFRARAEEKLAEEKREP